MILIFNAYDRMILWQIKFTDQWVQLPISHIPNTEPHSNYLWKGFSFKSSISRKSINKLVRFYTRRIKIYTNTIFESEERRKKKNKRHILVMCDYHYSKPHRFPAIWSVQCKFVQMSIRQFPSAYNSIIP